MAGGGGEARDGSRNYRPARFPQLRQISALRRSDQV